MFLLVALFPLSLFVNTGLVNYVDLVDCVDLVIVSTE